MFQRWRLQLRSAGVRIARILGSPIVDQRTGRVVGRALLLPFRGKIWMIGMDLPVVPIFLPQRRVTFWKQAIGFTTHTAPDFSHQANSPRPRASAEDAEAR